MTDPAQACGNCKLGWFPSRLIPVRALALRAPGRELCLAGRPVMTAPQAGVVQ